MITILDSNYSHKKHMALYKEQQSKILWGSLLLDLRHILDKFDREKSKWKFSIKIRMSL